MEITLITNVVAYIFTANILYGNLSNDVRSYLGSKYLEEISVSCAAIVSHFDTLYADPNMESIRFLRSKIMKLRKQIRPVEKKVTLLLKENKIQQHLWLRASAYLTLSTINCVERTTLDIERELDAFSNGDIRELNPNIYDLESTIKEILELNRQYLIDELTLHNLLKWIDHWEHRKSRYTAQHFLMVLDVLIARQDALLKDLCALRQREIDSEDVYLSFEADYLIMFNFKLAINSRWLMARYRAQVSNYLNLPFKARPALHALHQCA